MFMRANLSNCVYSSKFLLKNPNEEIMIFNFQFSHVFIIPLK